MAVSPVAVSFVLGVVAVYLVKALFPSKNANKPPLPPGPKGLPLLGNLNDLPKPGEPEYLHWLKFKDQYGSTSWTIEMSATLLTNYRSHQLRHSFGFNHCHRQ